MAKEYIIYEVGSNNVEWENLIEISDDFTPFLRDDLLSAVGYKLERFIIKKGNVVIGGLGLPRSVTSNDMTTDVPFAPYQGFIFTKNTETYSSYHNNLEAMEGMMDFLYEKGYDRIAFSNNYTISDIRGILWHHYHTPELRTYRTRINYTAILDIKNFELCKMEKGRRKNYRKCKVEYGLKCEISDEIEEFIYLYHSTFNKQGLMIDETQENTVRNVLKNAIKQGYGKLWYAYNKAGKALSGNLILFHQKRAYTLLAGNDTECISFGAHTFLLVEVIQWLQKESSVELLDFVGANSPYRGDFKLSFGAELKPYYSCYIDYR